MSKKRKFAIRRWTASVLCKVIGHKFTRVSEHLSRCERCEHLEAEWIPIHRNQAIKLMYHDSLPLSQRGQI